MSTQTSTQAGTSKAARSAWRSCYHSIVRNIAQNSVDKQLPLGGDDDPAPPCFFYGTLMALPVLYNTIYGTPQPPEHVTSHLTVRPAILRDHRRRFIRHSDFPGVTIHKGSEVAGSLVIGLTKGNMRDLHRFEGSEYMIASIKVNVLMKRTAGPPGPSGELTYKNEVWKEMDAVTYLYIAGEYRLENREWSFNKYMEYHMANWSGLSVSQAANQLYDTLGYWKDATRIVPDKVQ